MEKIGDNTNEKASEKSIEEIVIELSENFSKIIPRDLLRPHKKLDWGDNGIGDRWCGKKFNYTSVTNKGVKVYSENTEDSINPDILAKFLEENKTKKGILGIFVHSKRENIVKRPIRKEIDKEIKKNACVSCGSRSEIICDHKNDIYNDARVLDTKTQVMDDFQPLCNHCNLQKRQIFKDEIKNGKIYSAKNLQKYQMFPFEFPWEKVALDISDIKTKKETYWYDPVEFNRKIYLYITITLPILGELRRTLRKTE